MIRFAMTCYHDKGELHQVPGDWIVRLEEYRIRIKATEECVLFVIPVECATVRSPFGE